MAVPAILSSSLIGFWRVICTSLHSSRATLSVTTTGELASTTANLPAVAPPDLLTAALAATGVAAACAAAPGIAAAGVAEVARLETSGRAVTALAASGALLR
jgi:hypothetical protein